MDYLWAFLIGGLFCAIGQVLMDFTKLTPARILVAYVTGGVLLGALSLRRVLNALRGGILTLHSPAPLTARIKTCGAL